MKTRFTLLVLLIAFAFAGHAQQVPNNSFNLWTTDTLSPNGWSTYESIFQLPLGLATKDAIDRIPQAGPYSLRLTSDSLVGADTDTILASYGVMAGVAGLGAGSLTQFGPVFSGDSFTYRPDTLFVVYKYTSLSADTPVMFMKLTNGGTSVLGHPTYGAALFWPPSAQWAAGYLPIASLYNDTATPDTLTLEFYSSNPLKPAVKGSVLHIDGILFSYVTLPTSLQEVADKLNISIYPNPATDMITISTDENTTDFRAVITDVTGKFVTSTNLTGTKTNINVSELANGTYIYRIADAKGNILKQNRFNVVK